MTALAEAVERFIQHEALLPDGATIVVAVSGGADSLTLLGLLDTLAAKHHWKLIVATIDHRWTAAGAEACDEVERLARRLGWPCERHRLPHLRATEAAARHARLNLLATIAESHGAAAVALGHTADDRVETLLLNLLRGAGLTGLGAMPPRAGLLVRPLLELTREQTRAYVASRGWMAQADPTNASRRFDRNRLRLDVLPLLRAFRPGAAAALRRASRLLGAEREAMARYAELLLDQRWVVPRPEQALGGLRAGLLNLSGWADLPEPERWLVLRAFCARVGSLHNLELAAIERLDALAGGRADAGLQRQAGLVIGRCHGALAAVDREFASWGPVALPTVGDVAVDEVALTIAVGEANGLYVGLRAEGELAARSLRPGDRYQLLGTTEPRTIAKRLAQLGVPRQVRLRVPVIVCGDEPVWVPGLSPAEGWGGPRAVAVRYGPPGLWYDGAALRSTGR